MASRAPGRVERSVWRLVTCDPDGPRTAGDLAERAHPEAGRVEKRHRVSVLRAARRVVANDPDWALRSGRKRATVPSVRAGVFVHPGAKPGRPSR